MAKVGRKLFDGKDYDIVVQKLEQAWALDCSDVEAAAYADISSAALSDFLKKNPKVSERKARLKQRPVLQARSVVIKKIQAGDAKLALQYLERKKSGEFSTMQKVAGPDGKPLPAASANVVQVYIPHNNRDPIPEPKKK
jgi:hypothetical protein